MSYSFNRGDWVRFTNCIDEQVKWGGNSDPRGVLKQEGLYAVTNVDVHKYHTKLRLEGYPNLEFNSVHFEPS